MTLSEGCIDFLPYIFLIIITLSGFPASILKKRFEGDNGYIAYAEKFNTLCLLASLPIISGVLGASNIFSYLYKNLATLNGNILIVLFIAIIVFFGALVFIMSIILNADLVPDKDEIKLPLIKNNVSFYKSSKIINTIGVAAPAILDLSIKLIG
jgi:hypothetical protein